MQDKLDLQNEVNALVKNIDHIKVIVSMQQDCAKVSGLLEELEPKDLMEDAVRINEAALKRHGIDVIRAYEAVPNLLVDQHQVLQILINLINNAKCALSEKSSGKQLWVSVSSPSPDRVRMTVSDNGVGVAPENLQRIFSQGFTTRKDGHGFGLHSGANTAKVLGGSLTVQSAGLGQGATFTLELPAANVTAQGLAQHRLKRPMPVSGTSMHIYAESQAAL
jgi:signal transduction histidine kinase